MLRATLRRGAAMNSYSTTAASPFTKAVVSSMRKLYPESLADKSFDNTGLLLEAPFDPIRRQMNSVLLTVDLTKAVAEEAIDGKHCAVVAYHPIIFRGLKSLTLADPQQQSLLRLALEGISVYCPHTAVDAVPDGMADWLCDVVTGTLTMNPEPATRTGSPPPTPPPLDQGQDPPETPSEQPNGDEKEDPFLDAKPQGKPERPGGGLKRHYSRPTYPLPKSISQTDLSPSSANHSRTVIHPSPSPLPEDYSEGKTGMGRLVTFKEKQPLTHLIERIARGVGNPRGFPVAIPQNSRVEDIMIGTVGICPGSGGHVLHDCGADLLFTGELTHHEALAVTERGAAVVTLFHSNSERGFLHSVMKNQLTKTLKSEWEKVREEMKMKEDANEEWEDALNDDSVAVEVSKVDRDPYGMVLLQGSSVEGTKLS